MNNRPAPTETTSATLERYREPLWRLTAGYASLRQDREDLFQDVLLAVWQALPRFRGECSERTFVYRVAHNRGLTHRSRRRRWRVENLDRAADAATTAANPEATTIERGERQSLHAAVRELPLAYREVVLLRLEGLPTREISEIVGITENNVDVRLVRARQKLRKLLNVGESP